MKYQLITKNGMIFNGKSKRETVEKCILSDVDYYTSMELNGEIEGGTLTAPTGKQEVITLKKTSSLSHQ